MHRDVRHLVNIHQIESLIHDLELCPFQGILFSEHSSKSLQSTNVFVIYRKTRKESEFSRQYELKWQSFYHVHASSTKTTQNLQLKKKNLQNFSAY